MGVSVAVVVAVIDIKGSMISVAWSKIKNARKREKGCKKISEKIQNVSAISIINICDLLVWNKVVIKCSLVVIDTHPQLILISLSSCDVN